MEENLIKKVKPHDELAENSVIGSMIMDKDAIAAAMEILGPEDFYEKRLGVFFDVIVQLYNEGVETDVVTILDRLKSRDVPEEYVSLEYITRLIGEATISAHIEHYAKIVRGKSLLRQYIKVAENSVNNCYLNKDSVENIFSSAEQELFKILQKSTMAKDLTSISDIVIESLNNVEKASKTTGAVTGIATGFLDLDYKTAGLQPSDLVLIAARPSMGKTAFVLNIAEYMAIKNNNATVIFSLEMSKTQLVNRLLAMHSRVDAQKLRTGKLDENEWVDLMESARTVGSSSLIIDDTPGISVKEIRSKCRKLKLEKDLKVVIIDYIQLVTSGGRSESRQQEVSEISRALKALAREINCPVIALSQLSRDVEKRDKNNKRPMLSDLRESGAIEQDADVVMFIYRDEYYNKDTEHPGEAEIIIAKQRNGPLGTINLKWLAEYTKFVNLKKENG